MNNLPVEIINKILDYHPTINNSLICKSFKYAQSKPYLLCECNDCLTLEDVIKKQHLQCFKYILKYNKKLFYLLEPMFLF